MLPKPYRLRRPADFARLREEGAVFRNRSLLLSIAPNDLTHNRYGYITTRAIGNAVTRNRVRRLLREVIRQQHDGFAPGYDIVLIARRNIVGKPLDEIARIVNELATQAQFVIEEEPDAVDCP